MYPDILNSPLLYNSQGSSRDMSLFWENLSHSVNTTLEDYNGDYGHILDVQYLLGNFSKDMFICMSL